MIKTNDKYNDLSTAIKYQGNNSGFITAKLPEYTYTIYCPSCMDKDRRLQNQASSINDLFKEQTRLKDLVERLSHTIVKHEKYIESLNKFIDAKNQIISRLNEEISKSSYSPEHVERLGRVLYDMQSQIEQQNGIIGAKQEEINNLKIELNKAKAVQVKEEMPAIEIIRSFEDKMQRLLNIISSKDEIIKSLQDEIRKVRRYEE